MCTRSSIRGLNFVLAFFTLTLSLSLALDHFSLLFEMITALSMPTMRARGILSRLRSEVNLVFIIVHGNIMIKCIALFRSIFPRLCAYNIACNKDDELWTR